MDVNFRNLEYKDFWALFAWRHDPETVRWSFQPPPTAQQHGEWFNRNVDNPDIFMGEAAGDPVVTVNVKDGSVGVTVNPLWRGKGIGTQAIRFLQSRYDKLKAEVIYDNSASMSLFNKCGFKITRMKKNSDRAAMVLEWEKQDA